MKVYSKLKLASKRSQRLTDILFPLELEIPAHMVPPNPDDSDS